ncbi:hypothetical protein Taro_022243 [Colocasia esculenta]|uniref:Uncharacterized protein n=1 Tax=Colocasia esculenta TaxID=4460 RepID=A0A843V4S4_COLES|nr:hypothetical protein [Colocasia esculenta]
MVVFILCSGSSYMSWKERKELENRKVVALGGKVSKIRLNIPSEHLKLINRRNYRRCYLVDLTLVTIDHSLFLETLICCFQDMYLGRFQKKQPNERSEKQKNSEAGVLMASEGFFKKGVLDVKHLLKPSRPKSDDHMSIANRKKKGKGKKRGGKKKRKH